MDHQFSVDWKAYLVPKCRTIGQNRQVCSLSLSLSLSLCLPPFMQNYYCTNRIKYRWTNHVGFFPCAVLICPQISYRVKAQYTINAAWQVVDKDVWNISVVCSTSKAPSKLLTDCFLPTEISQEVLLNSLVHFVLCFYQICRGLYAILYWLVIFIAPNGK